ncbi:MAG: flagellin [Deferribacterales bacterium]
MAISVSTNISSIIAQNYAASASAKITKNISKLSSGLRINSAADDASGMAISEKLKSQIRGINRASMNAQDGISLLQTAEGGLESIQSLAQRMRELAVQASNGIYTSTDREEIQKEIDQLNDEIDHIAESTEFNTRKLLNGNSSALWSSASTDINVNIKGKVAEGNYRMNISVEAGDNYVYKTDVMTLSEDSLGGQITTAGGTENSTNVVSVSDLKTIESTGTSYYTVTIGGDSAVSAASASVTASYLQKGSMFSLDTSASSVTFSTPDVTSSGYVEVQFSSEVTSATTTVQGASFRYIDAKSGHVGNWQTATVTLTGDTALVSASGMEAEGGTLDLTFDVVLGTGGRIQNGDKVLLTVNEDYSAAADISSSGGGTVRISGGASGQAGPTIYFTGTNTLTLKDDGDTDIDFNGVTVYYSTMDEETGSLNIGSMSLNFKEATNNYTDNNGLTTTGSFHLDVNGAGEAATTSTKLKDISRFVTDDGRNLFDQTQSLTIYGNGRSATIYLEGDDTISDFEQKLQNAIVDGLAMGVDTGTSENVSDVNNNLVNFVGSATEYTNEALEGTFIIQTAKLGLDGMLTFAGDEELINALSLATLQEGSNSALSIDVYDAHTGSLVGSDTVNDYKLKDVIAGIDVEIDSSIGLDISWDDTQKEMRFSSGGDEEVFLHLVDNSTILQIGAYEGQTADISIGQTDSDGLGLDEVFLVDQERAQNSITIIDKALSRVSSIRADVGAQISRLEYTIAGLGTASENLTSSLGRIQNLDMAKEMTQFTMNQILSQAAVSMIGQANSQPQLALSLIG